MLFTTLAVLLVGGAVGQVHLGPVGDSTQVDCYHCWAGDDEEAADVIPGCLNKVHKCHLDEVCVIKYGNGDKGGARITCEKRDQCQKEIQTHYRNCTGGGVEVNVVDGGHHPPHHGPGEPTLSCEKCCEDTQCVSDLVNLLKLEVATSDNLQCPGRCDASNLQACMDAATRCGKDQYCKVTKDDHGVHGTCHDDHDYNHCLDETQHNPDCQPDHYGHVGHCVWDCCTSNACLANHFPVAAPANATTSPGASTPVMTSQMTSQVPNASCVDNVTGPRSCAQLDNVCDSPLAPSICAKFCGLCS